MHPFPHLYHVTADGRAEGVVRVAAEGLPALDTSAPPEFDGPPGLWSPETMLAGAVANCFILSFRAVARASRLDWQALDVSVEGVLDRVDGVTRFKRFEIAARLCLPEGASETLARTVLDKAKKVCLVTNSLNADCVLQAQVLAGCETPA
jgi:organic hydroperoxide reductase OsmC/OhrA